MSGAPTEPVALRLRSGERRELVLDAGAQMELYAEAIHAGRPGLVELVAADRGAGGRLEIRPRRSRGNYLEAGDRVSLRRRAEALSRADLEVFVTPATLTAPEPGNDAVAESQVVWVDIDEPRNVERLRGFRHRPHLVVFSGGSGGVHAYFKLDRPIPGEAVESANRRLVEALGGDRQSTNRARILRLPGTRNRKRHPPAWCRIVMCDLARPGHDVAKLCEGLRDPRERRPEPVAVREGFDEPSQQVAPPAYFAAIAGIDVGERGGLVNCPHARHPDRHPSAMVYPEPGRGWFCFACSAGGGPIDLVSALEGGPTGRELKGEEFKRAKRDCHERLGPALEETGRDRDRGRVERRMQEVRG